MSALFLIFILLAVITGAGLGLLRGLYKTLIRCAAVLIGVILSVCFAKLVAPLFTSPMLSIVNNLLSMTGFSLDELFTTYPELAVYSSGILNAVSAIPLYIVGLILFSLLMYFAYLIASKFALKNVHEAKVLKIPGAAIGAVMGVFVALLILSPFTCTLNMADEAINTASIDISDATVALKEVTDNGVVRLSSSFPYSSAYKFLTSYGSGEGRTDLKSDILTLASIYSNVKILAESSPEEYGDQQKDAVTGIIETVKDSGSLKLTIASILATTAQRIQSGETVFGVDIAVAIRSDPEYESFSGLLETLAEFMSTTTPETLDADLDTFSALAVAIIDSGLLEKKEEGDSDTAIDKLMEPGVISSLVQPVLENERAMAIMPELIGAGLRMGGDSLGIPDNNAGVYNNLIDDLFAALRSITEADALRNAVSSAFTKAGLNIKDSTVGILSDYLFSRTSLLANPTDLGTALASAADCLLNGGSLDSLVIPDGYVLPETDREPLKQLAAPADFTSNVLTIESLTEILKSASGKPKNNDPATEAGLLEGATTSLLSIASIISAPKTDEAGNPVTPSTQDVLLAVNDALQNMKKSDSIPDDFLAELTTGLLASSGISGSTPGLSEIAGALGDAITADDGGEQLDSLLTTAANGTAVIESITNNTEPKSEDVKDLISSMDDKTASTILSLFNLDFFKARGLNDEQAEKAFRVIKALITNMGATGTMTEEQLKIETDAVTSLIAFVNGIRKTDVMLFNSGDSTRTADGVVSNILASNIAMKTIIEVSTDASGNITPNPLGIASYIKPEDSAALKTALIDAYNKETAAASEHSSLTLALFLLGINIP